jgi:flagellar biosynthetic protein FliP
MKKNKLIKIFLVIFIFSLITADSAWAQNAIPKISIGVDSGNTPSEIVPTLQLLFLITILSLAPSILLMMTSFARIIIVFHFLRQSLSTQSVPSNQILVGLALFLTFFIMKPAINEINNKALQPYLNNEITQEAALENAIQPIRKFMLKQTREKDLQLFINLQNESKPKTVNDVKMSSLIPAFIISEIKTAFQIGFLLYLPMLLIDLIVGSILLSMGMMMLPPVMIAMPFKLLLFVLVDGWYLMVESLVRGF